MVIFIHGVTIFVNKVVPIQIPNHLLHQHKSPSFLRMPSKLSKYLVLKVKSIVIQLVYAQTEMLMHGVISTKDNWVPFRWELNGDTTLKASKGNRRRLFYQLILQKLRKSYLVGFIQLS